ncbi:hypothetical protein P7K49_004415 [Saguinus oedipus]|uniref:Uncharacterized protein n=1 Tax=Saguinus oedipus TaxID=9490 RepID=A0ABQ9W7B7_SAGOE|nr:hypothetical protein P7K49_004415 [Saguinus oedipus]
MDNVNHLPAGCRSDWPADTTTLKVRFVIHPPELPPDLAQGQDDQAAQAEQTEESQDAVPDESSFEGRENACFLYEAVECCSPETGPVPPFIS